MAKKDNEAIALAIKNMADKLGWQIGVSGSTLTIVKKFAPSNNDAFVQADGEYYSILSLLPQSSPGSTWGTDGGGIGALSAIKYGVFTMHKSGGNKNVLKALSRVL